MIQQLNEILELKRYDDFFSSLPKIVSELTEEERQELLVDLITYHYDRELFSDFKKAFDLIIGSKLNLNFNIEQWAPTFLSLIVSVSPERKLFDYFIKKGANINYIGDSYAFEDEETIKREVEYDSQRYFTCLDFVELKLADLIVVDYNYCPPTREELEKSHKNQGNNKNITISASEYHHLLEQSQYLWDLIYTNKIKDHIISSGGKTYSELKKEKSTIGNKVYK